MKLSNLLFAQVITPVLNLVVKQPKPVFPQHIGQFKYQRRFYPSVLNTYALAIYKDPSGNKAIAKLWCGKVRGLTYYALKNELATLKLLSSAFNRVKNSLPKKYSNIHIPALSAWVENRNQLIILKEYVEGSNATSLNTTKKINIYLKSNDFLEYLGKNLNKKEMKNVASRSASGIVILYPFLLIKALFANHKASWNLIKGIPLFLKSITNFLNYTSQSLGDRDLVLNNILASGKNIYLIDIQFAMYSNPLYDSIYRLCAHWDIKDLRLQLHEHAKSISKKYVKEPDTLIKGLMVHVATHTLTDNKLPRHITNRNLEFLYFALSGNE